MTTPANAQTTKPAPASTTAQPKPRPADPGVIELGDEPFRLESAGLTMFLPLGCRTETNVAGREVTARVVAPDQTWILNISTPRTSNPDTTITQVADDAIHQLLSSVGVVKADKKDPKVWGTTGKVLHRWPDATNPSLTVKNNGTETPIERFYLSLPQGEGKPAAIRGFTVAKTGPTQFVTFELITTEPMFAKARSAYETTVATAVFEDPTTVATERAAAIIAGQKVTEALNADEFRSILTQEPERWERLYKPAPTGADADATEIGYRRIRTSVGTRGDLDPARKGKGAADHQEGYIARMDVRVLSGKRTFDSRSIYFMTEDRTQEAWTVRMAIRENGGLVEMSENGARNGISMSVQVEGTGRPTKVIKPTFVTDGYVSRVEAILLPQIIVRTRAATTYGFYGYQSDSERVCLRNDVLDQPKDQPGLWTLTTKLSEDKPPQVSYFNDKGQIVRTELPDGTIWEPITLDQLAKLWKAKGLPMD